MAVGDIKLSEILLITTDNSLRVVAVLGPTPAKITDGFGMWEIVTRPRRTSILQYSGRNPFKMLINIVFDGYADDVAQDHKMRVLTWMSLPPKNGHEPRPVKIYGGALPFPSGGQWQLTGLTAGDNTIWGGNGDKAKLLRQDMNIELTQFNEANRVAFEEGGLGFTPTSHRVIAGDTIQKIADKYYGDFRQWHKIADTNLLADPKHLKLGTVLRIP